MDAVTLQRSYEKYMESHIPFFTVQDDRFCSEMSEKMMINNEEKMNERIELTPELLEMIVGCEGKNNEYTCKIYGKTFKTVTSIACHMSSVHK